MAKDRSFKPLDERGIYRTSRWAGGTVYVDDHQRDRATLPDASADLLIAASKFDGRMTVEIGESWEDSAGRSQRRAISVTLSRPNAEALYRELGKVFGEGS